MDDPSLVLLQRCLCGVLGLHHIVATFVFLVTQLVLRCYALVVGRTTLDKGLECAESTDVGEHGVVARNRLHQGAEVWPRHPKHKRPILVRIQVRVGQDEETFVGFGGELVAHDDIEEVLGAELLAIGVQAHPRLDQLIDLQVGEV